MRLALIGPLPPPSGGMANQTLQLQRLLQQAGVEVELVQVNAPYRPQWIGSIRVVRAVARLGVYLLTLWRVMGRVEIAHVMANSGWAWHLFAAPAIWLGRLRGVPVVVNYRGGYAAEFLARQAKWVRWSMSRAARLIVPSGFLQAIFERHGMASQLVPNIVDLQRFNGAESAALENPVILVTRNLEPIYDNASALQALAIVRRQRPDIRMVIAGSGEEAARLQTLAAELGVADAVNFTGRVAAEAMPALYRSATMALNPSTVDNMPNSVLEALAAGVPVVSTRVGGVPYMVTHEQTALLVESGDAAAMAAALLRLLREPTLYMQLRNAGRAAAAQYSWDSIQPRLFAVYAEVLRPKSAVSGART